MHIIVWGDIMNKNNKKALKDNKLYNEDVALSAIDLINKYGTYEIQETAGTPNAFPKIAQGLPKDEKTNRK